MAFVSIYTVGKLNHPYEHPASQDFYEVGFKVMRQASVSGNLIEEFSPDGVPTPEEAKGDGFPVQTLTVWRSLESLYQFTYSGRHSQALRNRSKWMESYKEKYPSYVVWWTEDVKEVSWEEAFKRYSYYSQNGPSPFAFDFKHPFNEKGETYMLK
jgi:hypothetical protein